MEWSISKQRLLLCVLTLRGRSLVFCRETKAVSLRRPAKDSMITTKNMLCYVREGGRGGREGGRRVSLCDSCYAHTCTKMTRKKTRVP